jgi:hypothetical protein
MTVESFLDDIRTASTRTSYVSGICSFIHFIYSLPPIKGERRTKEERDICFKKCNDYLKETRNHGDDIIACSSLLRGESVKSTRISEGNKV